MSARDNIELVGRSSERVTTASILRDGGGARRRRGARNVRVGNSRAVRLLPVHDHDYDHARPRPPRSSLEVQAASMSSSTQTCVFWLKGQCSFGAQCKNAHGQLRDRAAASPSTAVCPHFLRGACKFGDQCRLPHTLPSSSAPRGECVRSSSGRC
jgi:hypothetical protein